jgi:hypothetical protein
MSKTVPRPAGGEQDLAGQAEMNLRHRSNSRRAVDLGFDRSRCLGGTRAGRARPGQKQQTTGAPQPHVKLFRQRERALCTIGCVAPYAVLRGFPFRLGRQLPLVPAKDAIAPRRLEQRRSDPAQVLSTMPLRRRSDAVRDDGRDRGER